MKNESLIRTKRVTLIFELYKICKHTMHKCKNINKRNIHKSFLIKKCKLENLRQKFFFKHIALDKKVQKYQTQTHKKICQNFDIFVKYFCAKNAC